MLIPPMWWDRQPHTRTAEGESRVVLLHGLGRSWHAMNPLARRLHSAGFSTLNLPYPSLVKPLDWILDYVDDRISQFAGNGPVHLVGHSLGGIISRMLIARGPSWKPGRLVMMAPPNGGSEIIDWLSGKRVVKPFLSSAARSLASDGVPAKLPPLPPGLEAIVIMGNRSSIPFFRKLLATDNDGIVSTEAGRIAGLKGFSVVDADHTFIQVHPETVRRTLAFLTTGASAD
ncbi:MAG TPA: alpha/beta fold hydrolase [Luteolibacter sp.]|nr:alpha/beta fold hydrolase [Luteolibacter sp.]